MKKIKGGVIFGATIVGLAFVSLAPSANVTIARAEKTVEVKEQAIETVAQVAIVEEIAEVWKVEDVTLKNGKTVANLPAPKREMARRIAEIAIENGADADFMVKLAFCESTLTEDITRTNTDRRKTTDRGIFQINDYWHAEVADECAFDLDCATEWSAKWINKGKKHEWMCTPIIEKW